MSASMEKIQEMEVINFVYRISQVVKRLDNGRTVSRDELDRLLEQRHEMSAAARQLRAAYPELPGICERMCLRLQALLGECQAPPSWSRVMPVRAPAEAK